VRAGSGRHRERDDRERGQRKDRRYDGTRNTASSTHVNPPVRLLSDTSRRDPYKAGPGSARSYPGGRAVDKSSGMVIAHSLRSAAQTLM